MNKILKFRAWDKNHKKILYVGDSEWTSTLGKMIDFFENEDLMQFTGLKDKKGKEIYEGDILDFEGFLFQVMFSKPRANFYGKYKDEYKALNAFNFPNSKVIGNIYENPELLK